MGLSFTDAASLVTKGYKVSELQEVNKILEANNNDNSIIELAKKLGYSDFKSAMTLFDQADNDTSEEHDNEETTQNDLPSKDTSEDDPEQGKEDGVDYKTLYENEKRLREEIQKTNQSRDVSGEDTKESDFDIALKFAQSVLN